MGVTIGRFGTGTLTVVEADKWDDDGSTVRAAGVIQCDASVAGSAAAAESALLAERDRGLGLVFGRPVERDERHVPVTLSIDGSQDGSYEVIAFSAAKDLALTHEPAGGVFECDWSATLERLPVGFAVGKAEELHLGALRTNAHSITTSDTRPFIAIPAAALSLTGIVTDEVVEEALTCADGTTVRYLDHGTSADRNHFFDLGYLAYRLDPANWYDGSCSVSIEDEKVVGRNPRNVPDDWAITNEVIRLTPAASGVLRFEAWSGGSWESKDFKIRYGASGSHSIDPHAVTINRASPECCSIKLHYETTLSSEQVSWTLDLTIRRGSRYVEGYFYSPDYAETWGIALATSEAGTDITGGLRATSNDANGNRYVICTAATDTTNTTNGWVVRSVASEVCPVMFGLEVGGSGASGMATAQNMVYAYHSPVNTHLRVVVP